MSVKDEFGVCCGCLMQTYCFKDSQGTVRKIQKSNLGECQQNRTPKSMKKQNPQRPRLFN